MIMTGVNLQLDSNVYTVELQCLELEGTVKMCLSYRKFESPKFGNFREKKSGFDPGQFHSTIIN